MTIDPRRLRLVLLRYLSPEMADAAVRELTGERPKAGESRSFPEPSNDTDAKVAAKLKALGL